MLGMGGQAASAPASKGAEGGGRMRSIPHGVDIPEGQGCRVVGAAGAGSHGVAEAWPAALVGGWSGLASGNDDPPPHRGTQNAIGPTSGVAPAAAQRLARHRTAPRTGRTGHSTPPSHAPSPWRAHLDRGKVGHNPHPTLDRPTGAPGAHGGAPRPQSGADRGQSGARVRQVGRTIHRGRAGCPTSPTFFEVPKRGARARDIARGGLARTVWIETE